MKVSKILLQLHLDVALCRFEKVPRGSCCSPRHTLPEHHASEPDARKHEAEHQ